jgi:hypothetical protein
VDAVETLCETTNVAHMVEGFRLRYRAMPAFANLSPAQLAANIHHAIWQTVTMCQANPRLAVHHYFRDKHSEQGELQLLLPLWLTQRNNSSSGAPGVADLVVAVRLRYDEVAPGQFASSYEARTVLSVAMARNNARVIGPIDQPWLSVSPSPFDNQS